MTKELLTVTSESNVSHAIAKMRENHVHSVPILDGKYYVGMVSYIDLIRRRSLQIYSKVTNYMSPTPSLSPGDNAQSIVRKMKESGLSALPVIDGKTLVGIVTTADIVRNFEGIAGATNFKAMNVMTASPLTVKPTDTVTTALEYIRDLDEYEIPVTTDEKLTGILRADNVLDITVRERESIKFGQYQSRRSPVKVLVNSVMEPPKYVDVEDNVIDVAKVLHKEHLHMIPVVDKTMKIHGVIDLSDLMELVDIRETTNGLFVNISGLGQADQDLYDITYFLADKYTQRLLKIANRDHGTLNIHVMKYKTRGSVKYSVRTKLSIGSHFLSVDYHGWNYGKCLSEIFEDYELRLKRALGKD